MKQAVKSYLYSLPGYVLIGVGICLCRAHPSREIGTAVTFAAAILIDAVSVLQTRAMCRRMQARQGGVH